MFRRPGRATFTMELLQLLMRVAINVFNPPSTQARVAAPQSSPPQSPMADGTLDYHNDEFVVEEDLDEGLRRPRRRARISRMRLSSFGMRETTVVKQYRLSMECIDALLGLIEADISPKIATRITIPAKLRLLVVLQFLATGSFQHVTSYGHGISQPMFSKILKLVLAALMKYQQTFIYMARDEAEENLAKRQFYEFARFPNVIGAVECTHVSIVPPKVEESDYRDRKLNHSINIQMLCNARMEFLNVCAQFPGSTHDARILQLSWLNAHMEARYTTNTIIVG